MSTITPIVKTMDWDSIMSAFLKRETKKIPEYIFSNKTFYKKDVS
jgi:hypothetical protein